MTGLRFWQVYVTLPPDENKRYTRNKTVGVAAMYLQDAVKLVIAQYPDGEIYSVQHRGEIEYSQFPFILLPGEK